MTKFGKKCSAVAKPMFVSTAAKLNLSGRSGAELAAELAGKQRGASDRSGRGRLLSGLEDWRLRGLAHLRAGIRKPCEDA